MLDEPILVDQRCKITIKTLDDKLDLLIEAVNRRQGSGSILTEETVSTLDISFTQSFNV